MRPTHKPTAIGVDFAMSSNIFCVRMWFTSGKIFDRVFDDYDTAREFMNLMINKPRVEDAHLWEL